MLVSMHRVRYHVKTGYVIVLHLMNVYCHGSIRDELQSASFGSVCLVGMFSCPPELQLHLFYPVSLIF